MTYKFKTSRQTEEILDRIDASEGLSWPTLARLSLSLSIRKGPLMEIELFTDSQGKELGRSTVTGEMDALYKCLIELQEGRFLPEEEYFPAYVKAHLDRGARLLEQEKKYARDLLVHLAHLERSI